MGENNIYISKVESVFDDNEGLRIKARIPYYDGDKTTDKLPYAFPLLPKFTHVNPKAGEMVLIFLQTNGATNGDRFFIGPVISQAQKMNYDSYETANSLLRGNQTAQPLPAPSLDPDNDGTLPDRDDIALEGRGNSDVILKNDELRIRCGFKKNAKSDKKDCLKFNKEDLGYIQMRYKKMKDHDKNDYSSLINIVADRINLLSHDSRSYFNLTDQEKLITDEELDKIYENAHKLPYGDDLVSFLKQFIWIFKNHTHPFSMDKPCFTEPEDKILSTNLDEMLSQSIRIN